MFSVEQYDKAIEALNCAKQQKIDGTEHLGCSVCGGDCHPEHCGHNPLYAMHLCEQVTKQSKVLHESLHEMSGVYTYMGNVTGPARVFTPRKTEGE